MIRYTGNPYVDAGVAVLELRLRKPCDQFTPSDLEAQAEEIEMEYRRKIWKSYLTVHFMNSAWVQHKVSPQKERDYVATVLESYKAQPLSPSRACAFCGQPANTMLDRSHVPLLTGEKVMVAGAGGHPGLPVCGYCVFAIHFYPLATLKVAGRPLFWWTSEPGWMRRLTARFRQDIEKVLAASSEEFANLDWPCTRLLHAARDVVDDMEKLPKENRPPLRDVVGIHATNLGAKPDYDELRIPCSLLEFWSEAGNFGSLYRDIELEAWEAQARKPRKGSNESSKQRKRADPPQELVRRNRLYEALGEAFRSPDYRERAKGIATEFFLQPHRKQAKPGTTALVEFFLEKVADMERERLDAIREIADAIVESRDLKWILNKLMRSGKRLYDYLPVMRSIQQKLSAEQKAIQWHKILLALDLTSDEDATARDTWLVSELVLIRIFERLAQSRAELLAEISTPDESPSPEQTT